jgi:anti-sigma B factor antagonist
MIFVWMLAWFVMEISRHCAGEEPIPLLGDTKRIDKPEIIVSSKDGALACLYGRIDIDSSPALRDRLLALLHSPHPNVVSIDLSAVNHIDSSGVATLIEALKIARGNRTELRLQGLHDRFLRLFESTGILSLFNGSTGTTSQFGCEAD